MNDIFDKTKRSYVMSRVKSNKNKTTELKLISVFKTYSIKGWRRNYKIRGKPDCVFHDKRVAIFTDGCFWHGHDCRNLTPKDNADFWKNKIEENKNRDTKTNKYLKKLGWKVIRIWECELKDKNIKNLIKKLKILL